VLNLFQCAALTATAVVTESVFTIAVDQDVTSLVVLAFSVCKASVYLSAR